MVLSALESIQTTWSILADDGRVDDGGADEGGVDEGGADEGDADDGGAREKDADDRRRR